MPETIRLTPNAEQHLSGEQEMLRELRRLLDERQKLGSIVSAVAVFSGYALQAARAPSERDRLECIELRLRGEAAELQRDRDGAVKTWLQEVDWLSLLVCFGLAAVFACSMYLRK